ncbi:MAG TPA: hypothetical protein VEP68_04145, partial [Anaeromyxobacteraceae bacterium]|nr:hypothetical protein [Anaeromyxobacteraceae bacterium]
VEALEEERALPGWNAEARALCLGAPAAERARELGWRHVLRLPGDATAEGVVATLADLASPGAFARTTSPFR